MLHELVELTDTLFCNSQREAFMNGFPAAVMLAPISWVTLGLKIRLMPLYCSFQDGLSVLDLAKSKCSIDENMCKIYNHFLERKPTLVSKHNKFIVLQEMLSTQNQPIKVQLNLRKIMFEF